MCATVFDDAQDNTLPNESLPMETRLATFVIIAAYNEQHMLARVAADVQRLFPNLVVVDDGSSDDTWNVARGTARFALRHVVNRGQGAALQTGLEFALKRGAQYIVTFDADGQHKPEEIERLLGPVASGSCDITLGSRFLGRAAVNLPWSRRAVLKLGVWITRVMNRLPVTDAHNGLRCFSRRAAEQITITADRMEHASELIDLVRRTKLPWQEVPVEIHYTDYSMGKEQSSLRAARILFHYLMARFFR